MTLKLGWEDASKHRELIARFYVPGGRDIQQMELIDEEVRFRNFTCQMRSGHFLTQ